MTLQTSFVEPKVLGQNSPQFGEIIPLYIDDFLEMYGSEDLDLIAGKKINFNINRAQKKDRINPILQLATPKEARIITELFKQAYNGTYPYKEYEDVEAVRNMLKEGLVNFILFKNDDGEVMGCLKFVLDFENKRGYKGGMAIKKKYLGKLDVIKAYIGSCVYFWKKYRKRILMWYGECRTAHSKVQYFTKICGTLPLAFFPNKDVFLHKIESDLFVIGYYHKTIAKFRTKKQPIIIPEALNCFNYASKRYELGNKKLDLCELRFNIRNLIELHRIVKKSVSESKFGYRTVELQFKGRDSYFRFLHTPQNQNIEKVEYFVDNLEELFIFVLEFLRYAEKHNIRYIEVFVSAYESNHQKVFIEAGMRPRGYIPCWRYSKETDEFEDCIVFNCYEEKIDSKIKLIPEGWDLINAINMRL